MIYTYICVVANTDR